MSFIASRAFGASAAVVGLCLIVHLPLAGAADKAADKTADKTDKTADKKVKVSSVADYRKCADGADANVQACLDALDVFVKGHPNEAFAAGKAVRATTAHWAAIPYFAKAFASAKKTDKAACADTDLSFALVSGLSLPAKHAEIIAASRTILVDKCWAETHQAILTELAHAADGLMAANVCPILVDKKQTSPACEKKPAAAVETPKWKEIDPKTVSVEDSAKVFKGSEGKALTLVKIRGSEAAYLIKFEGFRGPFNGRVVLHREQQANSGVDYFTQVAGARWVSVVARGSGALAYEVFPSGDSGSYKVAYDDQASKATAAKAVLDQFAKQQPTK